MTFILAKPIEPNSAITFRLVTGEQVIARLVEQNTTHLTVTKPVIANPVQENGSFGIFYTPFLVTADEDSKFKIPKTSLLVEPLAPREELAKAYTQMTSGIAMP